MASIQRSDTPAWLGKVGQVLGDGLERSQPAQRLDIAGETLAANHRDAQAPTQPSPALIQGKSL